MSSRKFVILLLLVLASVGCGGGNDTPTAPTPPPVAACESNNTASVSFGNRSASATHTVQWNGLTVATLGPGQTSQPIVVAAGVAHSLRTFYANSNTLACAASNPIAARCSTPVYTCAF
jgi:hypothetical protein